MLQKRKPRSLLPYRLRRHIEAHPRVFTVLTGTDARSVSIAAAVRLSVAFEQSVRAYVRERNSITAHWGESSVCGGLEISHHLQRRDTPAECASRMQSARSRWRAPLPLISTNGAGRDCNLDWFQTIKERRCEGLGDIRAGSITAITRGSMLCSDSWTLYLVAQTKRH